MTHQGNSNGANLSKSLREHTEVPQRQAPALDALYSANSGLVMQRSYKSSEAIAHVTHIVGIFSLFILLSDI